MITTFAYRDYKNLLIKIRQRGREMNGVFFYKDRETARTRAKGYQLETRLRRTVPR